MGESSKIQWCDHTFNGWEGCAKVSPGCAHCYAEAQNHRFGKDNWGKGKPRRLTSEANWKQPVKWNRDAAQALAEWKALSVGPSPKPRCPRVFCASIADWLDDEVPIEWLARLLKLIHDTPNLDWLLLTKRPQNFFTRITEAQTKWIIDQAKGHSENAKFAAWLEFWRTGATAPSNVWIGTSVEDQKCADERIPELLKIPARIRFLSVEPMLEGVEFSDVTRRADAVSQLGRKALDGIHWVIFGGESGHGARPCNIKWIRDGVKQCRAAGVAPFVKQLGANIICRNDAGFDGDQGEWPMDTRYTELDSGYQGAPVRVRLKVKKGGDWSEWPEDLRVREFPAL